MLGARESKHEVLREATNIALGGLVEPAGTHSVDGCELAIENYLDDREG